MRLIPLAVLVGLAVSSCDAPAPNSAGEPAEADQSRQVAPTAEDAPGVEAESAVDPTPVPPRPIPEPVRGAPAPPPLDIERLGEYFSAEEIAAIRAYDRSFRAASTVEELRAVYEEMFVLAEQLLECGDGDAGCREMTRQFTNQESPDLGIPGLQPSAYAEAGAAFSVDTDAWLNQARSTPSQADERFFALLRDFHGYDPRTGSSRGSFRECYLPFEECRVMNEPAFSYLGKGHYSRLLSQIDDYGAQADAFSGLVVRMRERLWGSLIGSACVGSAAEALSELEDVSRSARLSADERERLAETINAVPQRVCG